MLHEGIFVDRVTELPGLVDVLRRHARHRMVSTG